uniref:C-type lectin domain-containing protein n=1 Tax=Timema monikensis TaxID=170555 RepID=A0A7R9E0N8_9NEOP|nr:unnamed protein product [Timema monikensis]
MLMCYGWVRQQSVMAMQLMRIFLVVSAVLELSWQEGQEQDGQECRALPPSSSHFNLTTPPPRAGPGYELFPGLGYYKLHQEHTTWEEARRTCLKEGSHLLIVNSETEALQVVKVTYDRFPKLRDEIYVGINDLHTEGHFISVLGQPLTSVGYAEWMPNEPNDASGNEDCVHIYKIKLQLNDVSCDTKLPFIWLNRYKVHVTAKTWEEARKVCIAEKAHLVIINSEAEAKAVLKIWQEYPFPKLNPLFIFLGFNDIKGEGKYVTVTGEPLEDTGFVNLKHSAGSTTSVEQDSGPWEVDVEQTSSRCGAEEEIVLAALVKAPPPRAGPGYETVHGLGYYKLHTELNTWEEARRVCAEEGAHLAVINSKVEMDVILNIWSRHPKIMDSYLNSYAHVGFHDLYTEGNYLTVLGNAYSDLK